MALPIHINYLHLNQLYKFNSSQDKDICFITNFHFSFIDSHEYIYYFLSTYLSKVHDKPPLFYYSKNKHISG